LPPNYHHQNYLESWNDKNKVMSYKVQKSLITHKEAKKCVIERRFLWRNKEQQYCWLSLQKGRNDGLFYITPTVFVVVVKDRERHDMNFEGVTKINASFWAVINKYDER